MGWSQLRGRVTRRGCAPFAECRYEGVSRGGLRADAFDGVDDGPVRLAGVQRRCWMTAAAAGVEVAFQQAVEGVGVGLPTAVVGGSGKSSDR